MIALYMISVILLLVISVVEADVMSTTCYAISDKEVRALWQKWNDALKSMNVDNVLNLYWDQSVLVPMFSNHIRPDAPTKLEYFKHFLAKKPNAEIKEDYIDVTACNMAQYAGIYEFSLTDATNGAVSKALARFSYTYQTFDGTVWNIKSHHSSLMPKPPGGGRRLSIEDEASTGSDLLNFSLVSHSDFIRE